MSLVINIPRRKPSPAVLLPAAAAWMPVTFAAASREQAKRTFEAATSLINGVDPKGTAPG